MRLTIRQQTHVLKQHPTGAESVFTSQVRAGLWFTSQVRGGLWLRRNVTSEWPAGDLAVENLRPEITSPTTTATIVLTDVTPTSTKVL
jgi:hypothetical protein